ncbi:MAG: glycosyltransferase [Vicinamibacterales bacterium]
MTDQPLELSVIVVAPYGFEPMRRLIRYLAEQTIRGRMEIVIVGQSRSDLRVDDDALTSFGGHQVVEVGPITELSNPRQAGILAARAPIVALTEDHCFPAPDWAEALVKAHRGPWAAVGPAVGLANPQRYRAWTNYVLQYGAWAQPTTGGEMTDLPGHNSSYKRALLIDYGDRLADLLVADTMLHWDLHERGHRLFLDPAARVYHVYMTQFSPFISENYYIGRQFAAARRRRWSIVTRLAFIVGTPAIPVVRLVRILRRMRECGWLSALLPGILPSLFLALAASAAGEFMGYAFGMGDAATKTVDLDIRRDRFVHQDERDAIWGERLAAFPAGPPTPQFK